MTDKRLLEKLFPPRETSREGTVKFVPFAKWELVGDNQPISKDDVYRCSNCGGNRRFKSQFKPYCEDCGSIMLNAKEV